MNSNIKNIDNNVNDRSEDALTIQDYIIITQIHIKKIIAFTIIGLLISIYHTYNIPPRYQAHTTIEIREKPGANMIMDLTGNHNQNRMLNEIEVIKSRALAREVVKKLWNSNRRNNLHLFGTRLFYPKGQKYRNVIKEIFTLGLYDQTRIKPARFDSMYNEEIGDRFAENILSSLKVVNVRNTSILEITFTSPNADEARRISTIIAQVYIQYDSDRSRENATRSMTFLDSLVYLQEKKIEEKDNRIREFKLKNNMYSLEGDAVSIVEQLNNYEGQLYNSKSEINIRREKIEILNSKLTNEEKTLTTQLMTDINAQLTSLRIEIGRIESQITHNTNIYGPEHGAVIELNQRLDRLKKELDKKVSQLISKGVIVEDPLKARQNMITNLLNLESEIVGFELQEIEIKKMLQYFNQKLDNLPKKQMDLARLNRDEEVLNQNYLFLRKKLEESKINAAIQVGDAIMLDRARKPSSPIGPNHRRHIFLGILLGLGTGLFLSFLIEFMDNSLKSIYDIEKYGMTILGIIPAIGATSETRNPLLFWKRPSNDTVNSSKLKRRLMIKEDPKSPISEAYRSLRTSMLYSSDVAIKSILVSSAGPGEGKTTTVANLAITYANLGKKTLLVDTDLRRPVVHKVFNLPREPGVTNYLSSQTDDFNELIKNTDIENLSIITSGIIPPNPSEMLGSNRMIDLVKSLEKEWDMILFDSPPLVAVTDANMISKEIDRIVLIVKVGQTDKKAFHHTITNLKNIDAPLGGIIMNAVTNKSSYGSYYYYYYHQYYNYYGSGQESD